jgi:hypothetical protein
MPIPENQLKIWANFHQTQKAKKTHELIRKVIKDYDYSRSYNFEDYLQGSYANNTNIYADTDVDIVIQLNSLFHWHYSDLTKEQQKIINNTYPKASYSLEDFKKEVINALIRKFGNQQIKIGNKSIKVLPDKYGQRYKADIVIALQHRFYVQTKEKNTSKDEYTGLFYYEGIWFITRNGEEIVNYPKIHLKNGREKHEKTKEKFKPVVRIFKNMRNKAVDEGLINKNIAPSYFIQCLLYNVPNEIYTKNGNYQSLIEDILKFLKNKLEDVNENNSFFLSQNEIVPLFGEGSDKWDIEKAKLFVNTLLDMWDNWS